MDIFGKLITFFESIGASLPTNLVFYLFLGFFVLMLIIIFVLASYSYEIQLIKAVDKLNKYFVLNPQINEDNLVSFNERMKKVPGVLRKQWQQFMLYRENDASYYMSYKNCIENPIKTSTYKQQIRTLNIVTYCLSFLVFFIMLNKVYIDGITDVVEVLIKTLMIPLLLMLINWIVSIFMTLRINAVTSDLFQGFQYFQSNMDKATKTVPEYVDYEVLFTKKEIRQGIPVLFEYLEKRALIEQEELERARSKNAEHDKYNFEQLNIEASLVLERAMHEAETFISNRNRLLEEIDQIEGEISNIQNDYKQATKEYQRKMQAGKENLERLKQQMQQAASNIAANYIKKQQTDEMNRQQNLEREFDNVTARHKKDVQNLQTEIEKREKENDKLRALLEVSMMSEFDTYAKKVYDKVDVAINEKQKDKFKTLEKQLSNVQETSAARKEELDNIYAQYQMQSEKFSTQIKELESKIAEKEYFLGELKQAGKFSKKDKRNFNIVNEVKKFAEAETNPVIDKKADEPEVEPVVQKNEQPVIEEFKEEEQDVELPKFGFNRTSKFAIDEADFEISPKPAKPEKEITVDTKTDKQKKGLFAKAEKESKKPKFDQNPDDEEALVIEPPQKESEPVTQTVETEVKLFEESVEDDANSFRLRFDDKFINNTEPFVPYTEDKTEPEKPKKKAGRPRKYPVDQPVVSSAPKPRGRPRKVLTPEEIAALENAPKRERGRPKKVVDKTVPQIKKSRGRPKKAEQEKPIITTEIEQPKKSRGRPKKVLINTEAVVAEDKQVAPAKPQNAVEQPKKSRGRPKKIITPAESKNLTEQPKKPRGRPKKNS